MWKTVRHIDEQLAALDASDNKLIEMATALNQEMWDEAIRKNFVLVRAVQVRQCPNRFRIDWCQLRHVKKDGVATTKVLHKRIPLNKSVSKITYKQSLTRMGRLDQNHLSLFNRYDEKFAAIRELADRNGDYRAGLLRMRAIVGAVGL
ncbi:conjugative transfer protein MobI(A/C) [Pseudomonas zhanjiangensis]|uniref:Conjugative transfer protein MobI(A/C) n=1 Tax=Pseudomonas zhanjiangensis TaxID=3239015 RepID=A0ABV3YZB8_9PSED